MTCRSIYFLQGRVKGNFKAIWYGIEVFNIHNEVLLEKTMPCVLKL